MSDINSIVFQANEVIKNGGVILYPTDTVWGLGCDATNEEAINKIFEIKKRALNKSMIILVNERLMHQVFASIPEVAWQIMDLSEKPTTLVLDHPKLVAKNIIASDDTLAARLTKDDFCLRLIERMKKPLVSTSANISTEPTPKSFKEIDPQILAAVDYIVPLHQDKICDKPSTIIKLTHDSQVKIIRK
jgi:L-threonylcarbamoyladenylate synthase